eukprot:TRINITY_DN1242_c0_g1_i1.p1 TRINITY_DN1242_c0_g1~~TRINITY_DN1242_c0_g1_i1.p1  ORF type:complete len:291 (+),score=73.13 TRINITY_DN1242_c0_g1_i1:47-919(+)
MSLFRFMFAASIVALSVGQAPVDTGNSETIAEWCTVAADCLSNPPTPFPEGVACQLGFCTCTDGYVLHRASVCKEETNPNPPTVRVTLEITWDNVACDNLPAGFEATIETDIRRIYGIAITVVLNIKCGSVVVLIVMDDVDSDTAQDTNIATAMENSNSVALLGSISTVDTYAGTGSCPVAAGQKEVYSIGGVCQPISCETGYVLQSGTSVSEADTCELYVDDDELSGGAVAAIVVGVLGFITVVVLIIYSLTRGSADEEEKEQSVSENGPDNQNDENNENNENNGPDGI